jgi:uncharacterized protein YwgA
MLGGKHMFEEYGIICFAVDKCNQINGRKKFQKIFYLSKEMNIPLHETFEWNIWGPFSKELSSEITSLYKMKLLSEEKVGKEYVYSVSEKGKSFLEKVYQSLNQKYLEENLIRFEKILKTLNKYNSQELEKLASIRFLTNKGHNDEYIQTFLNYTKKYSPEEIESGKDLINTLFITLIG